MHECYYVDATTDAVSGTSVGAHDAALRWLEQAGAQLISETHLYCELQRDWARTEYLLGFLDAFQNWEGTNPEQEYAGVLALSAARLY